MQTRRGILDRAFMVVTSILLGFLAVVFTQSLFMLFFTPAVVYIIWSTSRRMNDLQRRVVELENPALKEDGRVDTKPDETHGEA
jgi:hypothetical protein